MIRQIFIGKPLHWLVCVLLIPVGYIAGNAAFHVTNFVIWASVLFGLTFVMIIAFWLTSHKQDQLTRDPIPDEEEVKLREYVD